MKDRGTSAERSSSRRKGSGGRHLLGQHLADVVNVIGARTERHRQRQQTVSGGLGDRKVTTAEAELLDVERLEVNGPEVRTRGDAARREPGHEGISADRAGD